jgi:pimeloyl-ACP methyl ester carboxylesterase
MTLRAGGRTLEHAWLGPGPREAPTCVFLHEGLGSVSTWRDVPARLAEAAGCAALVYSRAGHGRSDPPAGPRTVRYLHELALDVLPRTLVLSGCGHAPHAERPEEVLPAAAAFVREAAVAP